MQTNQNIEDKRIVEKWEWHDGWGKSCATKKVFRKLRRKKQKRLLDKTIKEVEEEKLMTEKKDEKESTPETTVNDWIKSNKKEGE